MKKTFKNRLEAVDWIASFVENEGQFEMLREKLNYNFIYTGELYLEIDEDEVLPEVMGLDDDQRF